jgi:hypothetical protein
MHSERFHAMADGLRLAARSLSIVARANRSLAEGAFADELPWLKWLPAEARAECVTEMLDHLLAGADSGLFVPFALTEGPAAATSKTIAASHKRPGPRRSSHGEAGPLHPVRGWPAH